MRKFQEARLRPGAAQLFDDAEADAAAAVHRGAGRLDDGQQMLVFEQHVELARRRGVLRWVCFASDAEPDPAWPGFWQSATFDMLASLPPALAKQGMDAIGYEWAIEPEPNHDDEDAA